MITIRTPQDAVKTINSHGTVMQSLEKEHVEHRSQCKAGLCGACKVKLNKGKVHYVDSPLGFVRKGEILPCVCIADGDIEIEGL
ncbi:hypothetical protein C9975_03005 [Thalassospira xiamenensis]|nr:hypothetical protein C9975_03005 [Thalassospira xiamenensis]